MEASSTCIASQLRYLSPLMYAAKDAVRFDSIELRPCRPSKRHLTNVDRVLGHCNIEQAAKTLFV